MPDLAPLDLVDEDAHDVLLPHDRIKRRGAELAIERKVCHSASLIEKRPLQLLFGARQGVVDTL